MRSRILGFLALLPLLPLLAACLGDGSSATTIPASNVDRAVAQLDSLAADVMQRSGIPGMAVAVVHQGNTVYAKGFGVRRLGDPAPVDADTVFQLASLSKSVGATVVATQVGQGVVRWDTPMKEKLPWFALDTPEASDAVTIGDLYSHQSGLPEHAGDDLEDLGHDRQFVLEHLKFLPSEPLRSRYAYTNFGLTTAAVAVATAAGTDWDLLSDQALYRPLGMTATSSRFADFVAHPNRAFPHILVNGAFQLNPEQRQPDAQSPAGGVSSSVRDMARWMALVLHEGEFEGQRLIPAEALAPALSPQILTAPPPAPDAPTGYYGYGFNISVPAAGPRRIGHSGAFVMGTGTNFNLMPAADTGIVVLTNALPVGAAEALGMMYLDLVQYGHLTRDWVADYRAAFEAQVIAPSGSLAGLLFPDPSAPPLGVAAYTGTYTNQYFGEARVIGADTDSLELILGPVGSERHIPLAHWDGNVFVFEPGGEMAVPGSRSAVTFAIGPGGMAADLTIELYKENGHAATLVRN